MKKACMRTQTHPPTHTQTHRDTDTHTHTHTHTQFFFVLTNWVLYAINASYNGYVCNFNRLEDNSII